MGNALRKEESEITYTYADYKNWELKDGERYELIYGEAYAMSAPNEAHQLVSGEIFKQLANHLTGKPCKVFHPPYDVRLFYQKDETDDTVVQPDITVVCGKEKRGSEGCRGAPDLVVEILSPSNSAIEMERKFHLYEEAGVREYWVVNPEMKTVKTHLFAEGNVHSQTYKSTDKARVAIFPGFTMDLESVFAEID
ncbi:MAG: Uma2 family endonuclease [Treponema sp.]|nr:Uma2 family endonuclease [Treponema sp.]